MLRLTRWWWRMSEWSRTRLGDVLTIKHGYAFAGDAFSDNLDFPTLVTPGNFSIGGGFKATKPKTFLGDYPPEYLLAPGDVVVTMTDLSRAADTLGYSAVIPDDGREYLHNQRIGKVVITDVDRADLKFVSYLLRGREYRQHVVGGASGSTVKHTSPGRIESFIAELPQLDEQKRIASVLGTFDDLIETNVRDAEHADELWRAVLRAEVGNESMGVALSSLAQFVNGRNFTKDASRSGLPVIRTPELRTGPSGSTVRTEVATTADRIANVGDILFVWSGSLFVSRWYWEPGLVNQHVFKVIPEPDVPDWLVMFAIEELMDDFLGVAADKATTMGHIKRSDLDRLVAVPPRLAWSALDAKIRPLWDGSLSARTHISDLARARDEILPLLMSGKIRVDERFEVA
ncbi:restriction endonuclease subunit S [Microbacterium arborescens]|uniref:restriction endonuclease subunit S n=1 Tax=Microbacterium arborescens TaxID=33883 RepID=UPI0025A22F3F|nr:restriction endonuclease subunit S [Microbacterium arborescens]WJM17148.1 restriction endonuclease subunit S [Microbacterium arborescens]